MTLGECGRALVLIYGDFDLESVLTHEHDGGEAYMGPVLKKAVQYAKTHYDSGCILDILNAEPEMAELNMSAISVLEYARNCGVRHIYYVKYRWIGDSGKKTYGILATHVGSPDELTDDAFPYYTADIPKSASVLV